MNEEKKDQNDYEKGYQAGYAEGYKRGFAAVVNIIKRLIEEITP